MSRASVFAEVVAEEVAPGTDPAAIAETPAAEPVGSDGLPVARPVLTETDTQELPAQRVQLPRPRAIEFE